MVSAAMTLFRREGYTATSWRRLVDEAGTPWGSAYHHFPGGKEELAVAAIELATDVTLSTVHRAFERNETAEEAVRWWYGKAGQALATGDYRSGCPLATVALEVVNDSPALTEACRAAFDRWHETLTGYLAGLGCEPASELATAIVTNLEGALLLSRVRRSAEPMTLAANHVAVLLRSAQASAGSRP
jgi:TetR/AcrR family transcriptional repressor of lmrAB and yxaGH operons